MCMYEDDLVCQPDKALLDLKKGKKLIWLEFEIDGKPVLNKQGRPHRFPHLMSAETMRKLHPDAERIEIVVCQKNTKTRTPVKPLDQAA